MINLIMTDVEKLVVSLENMDSIDIQQMDMTNEEAFANISSIQKYIDENTDELYIEVSNGLLSKAIKAIVQLLVKVMYNIAEYRHILRDIKRSEFTVWKHSNSVDYNKVRRVDYSEIADLAIQPSKFTDPIGFMELNVESFYKQRSLTSSVSTFIKIIAYIHNAIGNGIDAEIIQRNMDYMDELNELTRRRNLLKGINVEDVSRDVAKTIKDYIPTTKYFKDYMNIVDKYSVVIYNDAAGAANKMDKFDKVLDKLVSNLETKYADYATNNVKFIKSLVKFINAMSDYITVTATSYKDTNIVDHHLTMMCTTISSELEK